MSGYVGSKNSMVTGPKLFLPMHLTQEESLLTYIFGLIVIMRSLYLMPLSASTPVFIATNSAPNTEPSMFACFLLSQSITAVFKNMKYPVRDRFVILSPACSLSTHIHRSTTFPFGLGALGGDIFGHITIEHFPISSIIEGVKVNVWVCWVEGHFECALHMMGHLKWKHSS